MTGQEIIALAVEQLNDKEEKYLWSDAALIRHFNWAVNEFCKFTYAIKDSSTTAICQIAVVKDTASYALDGRIIEIFKPKLSNRSTPLGRTSMDELDRVNPSWRDEKGTPTHYLTDIDSGKIRLYPIPQDNDTLTLPVARLPLAQFSMANINTAPEFNMQFHDGLVDGILYRCYSKQDSDSYDPKKAAGHKGLFDQFLKDSRSLIKRSRVSKPINNGTFWGW